MDENERQEFSLEDIIREFGEELQVEEPLEALPDRETEGEVEVAPEEDPEEAPAEPEETPVSGDTIRLGDTVRLDTAVFAKGEVRCAQPVDEPEDVAAVPASEPVEAFSDNWEPEYEQPMGDYVPPQPIVFRPRSRLHELKRKLVAGPEKRYYDLSEKGLGKRQVAIFLSLLVLLICAGATALYALGGVQENRMRLMVFGQFLAMLVAAFLGADRLLEGMVDLVRGRFSVNTLLVITFGVCCTDAVFCLQQLRVPCCAAFCLEMVMSLWNAYEEHNTEMGQMDTMRKAIRLDSVRVVENYYEDAAGLLRNEGQVEDFMDHYNQPAGVHKALNWYALGAFLASCAIAVFAGVQDGVSAAFQTAAACLLVAVPATMFITLSRPMAVLERRMHALGTVLCGWTGAAKLSRKCVFPLDHGDLYPAGSVKMNGVKFFGELEPDRVVACTAAVVCATDGALSPLLQQLLESRNGRHYDAVELTRYEAGGLGAVVDGQTVLVGTLAFLKEMGIETPEGIRVSQAVCTAVDGKFSGLFALTYEKVKASAAGLSTLCAYRRLNPLVVADDFMLTGKFLQKRFGINPKKLVLPLPEQRQELVQAQPEADSPAVVLSTREGLAPLAYGVTGAKALHTAGWIGVAVHIVGGIVGLGMVLALALLGEVALLTPVRVLLYELVWMIPGLLITEWTRIL